MRGHQRACPDAELLTAACPAAGGRARCSLLWRAQARADGGRSRAPGRKTMTKFSTPRPPDVRLAPAAPKILTPNSAGVMGKVYAAPAVGKPESRFRDPLQGHLADVGAVERHITVPEAWLAVRERWASLVGSAHPCRDKLAQAV